MLMATHDTSLLDYVTTAANGFRKSIAADLAVKVIQVNPETDVKTVIRFIQSVCQKVDSAKSSLSIKPDKQAEVTIVIFRSVQLPLFILFNLFNPFLDTLENTSSD